MKLFSDRSREADEENIAKRCERLVKEICADSELRAYVEVLGISGTAARGEASPYGSDVDFYCITTRLDPRFEKRLRTLFDSIFHDAPVESWLLVFAPSIWKKPDLMLYEFTNTGKVLLGDVKKQLPLRSVPRWEAIRLLSQKACPFLSKPVDSHFLHQFIHEDEDYYFSKLITGIGEALLLLSGTYQPSTDARAALIKQNHLAKQLPDFVDWHKQATLYRKKKKPFSRTAKERRNYGETLVEQAWKLVLESYFQATYDEALRDLRSTKPTSLRQWVGSRLYLPILSLKYFRKLHISFREPFIKLILMQQDTRRLLDPKVRLKLAEYWICAPHFWRPR